MASTLFGSSNDPNTATSTRDSIGFWTGRQLSVQKGRPHWLRSVRLRSSVQPHMAKGRSAHRIRTNCTVRRPESPERQIRGTLNGTQTAITSSTFQQQWGLDATATGRPSIRIRMATGRGIWYCLARQQGQRDHGDQQHDGHRMGHRLR